MIIEPCISMFQTVPWQMDHATIGPHKIGPMTNGLQSKWTWDKWTTRQMDYDQLDQVRQMDHIGHLDVLHELQHWNLEYTFIRSWKILSIHKITPMALYVLPRFTKCSIHSVFCINYIPYFDLTLARPLKIEKNVNPPTHNLTSKSLSAS